MRRPLTYRNPKWTDGQGENRLRRYLVRRLIAGLRRTVGIQAEWPERLSTANLPHWAKRFVKKTFPARLFTPEGKECCRINGCVLARGHKGNHNPRGYFIAPHIPPTLYRLPAGFPHVSIDFAKNLQDAIEATAAEKCISCGEPNDGKEGLSYCIACRETSLKAAIEHLQNEHRRRT